MAEDRRIVVVGAGAMGTGFATHFSRYDLEVTLVDHRKPNLETAQETIAATVDFLGARGLIEADATAVLESLTLTVDQAAAVEDCDLVLETVSEDLAAKREVFRAVGEAAPRSAILATNTSSLSISDIAEGVPDHADRLVGCHWWYPPYLLRPVEVVSGPETAPETVARVADFVERVDRDPILVERDVPGFVWNRIQFAVVRECMHLAGTGVASIEDINRAVRDGYARRTAVIGPFETIDIAGLELFETIAEGLYPQLCATSEPHELFEQYRTAGKTGLDAGAGFFEYAEDSSEVTGRRDRYLADLARLLDEDARPDPSTA